MNERVDKLLAMDDKSFIANYREMFESVAKFGDDRALLRAILGDGYDAVTSRWVKLRQRDTDIMATVIDKSNHLVGYMGVGGGMPPSDGDIPWMREYKEVASLGDSLLIMDSQSARSIYGMEELNERIEEIWDKITDRFEKRLKNLGYSVTVYRDSDDLEVYDLGSGFLDFIRSFRSGEKMVVYYYKVGEYVIESSGKEILSQNLLDEICLMM